MGYNLFEIIFIVKDTDGFLKELRRIIEDDGTLVIDDDHQPIRIIREKTGCLGLVGCNLRERGPFEVQATPEYLMSDLV